MHAKREIMIILKYPAKEPNPAAAPTSDLVRGISWWTSESDLSKLEPRTNTKDTHVRFNALR